MVNSVPTITFILRWHELRLFNPL